GWLPGCPRAQAYLAAAGPIVTAPVSQDKRRSGRLVPGKLADVASWAGGAGLAGGALDVGDVEPGVPGQVEGRVPARVGRRLVPVAGDAGDVLRADALWIDEVGAGQRRVTEEGARPGVRLVVRGEIGPGVLVADSGQPVVLEAEADQVVEAPEDAQV